MRNDYKADVFYFNYSQDAGRILSIVELIKKRYKKVIIGIHNYNRVPANNFGISKAAVDMVTQLQQQTKAITFVFGNPYAIKNWCTAKNIVACYEDDEIIQNTAIDLLQGKITARGKLPVTVCEEYQYGSGIVSTGFFLPVPTRMQLALTRLNLTALTPLLTTPYLQEQHLAAWYWWQKMDILPTTKLMAITLMIKQYLLM